MNQLHSMTDKELQIALLRRIAEYRQVHLDDFLPSFLHSYENNPNITRQYYQELIPRCLNVLQKMYAKHGWITCYFIVRNTDEIMPVINRHNANDLEVRIEPRGEEYLERGRNLLVDPTQASLYDSSSSEKQTKKTLIRTINDIVAENKHRYPTPKNTEDARKKIAEFIASRRGQRKFRQDLLNAYGSRCLITGPNTEEILEAAHIHAYSAGGTFDVSNGLLLRADIHTLFDLGLVAINTKDMTVIIHNSLKNTSYREIEGKHLLVPDKSDHKPNKEALDDHRSTSRIGIESH